MGMHVKFIGIASILLTSVSLHGCKHPLAIVGEGDIVDIGNSGRGCTLEQFRAGDSACTENEVSGDYFVNYKAVPRSGWRFVRWGGPCPPDSDFQHCKFKVDKEAVAWWERTYPDNAIPPSTAVFQRIEGEIGYLLAGTPVVGVTYDTPTQQGVTGLDGSFQYARGETVRFRVGDTVLGEVVGKDRVTPFELAGSPMLTGLNIAPAIRDENHPFQAVINIAVLLQSLDHDVDPQNGIVIRQGVADLLHGVRLDLSEHWSTFQAMRGMSIPENDYSDRFHNRTTLRHALTIASRQQRFSVPHGIVRPPPALGHLYRTLEINPKMAGVNRLQLADGTGNVVRTERFQYDEDGYLTLHDDTTPEAFESWQYDARRNLTRHERQLAKYGFENRVETWQYDARGNEVRHERDYGADGSAEDIYTTRYRYDDYDSVIRIAEPADRPEGISVLRYDTRGHLIRRKEDWNADGTPDLVLTWGYDDRGYLVRGETDNDADGTPEAFISWQYDDNGRLIKAEGNDWYDLKNGILFMGYVVSTWEYDDNGNVTRTTQEWDDPEEGAGYSTGTWHYEYDSDGRMTGRRVVSSDGQVDEVETWQYDAAGRLTRNAYFGGSDSPEHVKAWRYDATGNMIEFTDELWDERDNSYPNKIQTWRYDAGGNLIKREREDSDSPLAEIVTWKYDTNDNPSDATLVRYNRGLVEETVTYRYAPTGWGYLFADVWVFPYPDDWPPEAAPFR